MAEVTGQVVCWLKCLTARFPGEKRALVCNIFQLSWFSHCDLRQTTNMIVGFGKRCVWWVLVGQSKWLWNPQWQCLGSPFIVIWLPVGFAKLIYLPQRCLLDGWLFSSEITNKAGEHSWGMVTTPQYGFPLGTRATAHWPHVKSLSPSEITVCFLMSLF